MSEFNDGGLAFAGSRYEHAGATDRGIPIKSQVEYPGMSLRDWFAGQVIGSIILDESKENRARHIDPDTPLSQYVARIAYVVADAMIAARKAGE